jgi:subtilisin family serine protease
MKVTVTTNLNRRINQPKLLPDNISGQLGPGDTIDVDTTVEGDMFEGISLWLKDTKGNFFWSGGTNYNQLLSTVINYADAVANMPQAWKDAKGAGITIAVIDSGMATTHPGIAGVIKYSKSFTTADATDAIGHGTGLAGLIASNGGAMADGVLGVARLCNLINIKVTKGAGSAISDDAFAAALDEVYALSQNQKIDIVNLSLNIPDDYYLNKTYSNGEKIEQKINKIIAQNMVIFAAAGDNTYLTVSPLLYPAMHPNCIAVGSFSSVLPTASIQNKVDFLIQNKPLKTASINGQYTGTIQRTSAYTGLLSGIAAAALSAGVGATATGTQKINAIKTAISNIAFSNDAFTDTSNSLEIKIYKK